MDQSYVFLLWNQQRSLAFEGEVMQLLFCPRIFVYFLFSSTVFRSSFKFPKNFKIFMSELPCTAVCQSL